MVDSNDKMPKYKIGDKVQLNVGGPIMSVSEVIFNYDKKFDGYRCQWFAGKKLDRGVFEEDCLVPAAIEEKKSDS